MFWVIDNNQVWGFDTKEELNYYMECYAGMDARRVDSKKARSAMVSQLVGIAVETVIEPEPASFYRDYRMAELYHDYCNMVKHHRNILHHCPLSTWDY